MRVTLALLVAALLVAGAVAVPRLLDDEGGPVALMGPANGDASTTTDAGVREFDITDTAHTSDDVDYPQSPAVGGQHDPRWLECGVYDRPVREENVVHALEHGTIWITYGPDLPAADVDELAALLPDEGILSPYDDQEAAIVITTWGRQLALDGVDVKQLDEFIGQFGNGETAPEPMASCHGGVTAFEDGTVEAGDLV